MLTSALLDGLRQRDNIGIVDPRNGVKREAVGGATNRYMWINANTKPGIIAHEVGHLMRLGDHYTDDKDGYSYPDPGWEGDITANSSMPVTRLSIKELIDKMDLKCECRN